ncbi:DUF2892 domain-containing protein [Bacteroidota bacterium]
MKKNMGIIDRIIRVVSAIVIGILYINGTLSGTTAIILLVVGLILLATSSIGWCPLYLPFGLKTKSGSPKE